MGRAWWWSLELSDDDDGRRQNYSNDVKNSGGRGVGIQIVNKKATDRQDSAIMERA